MLLVSAQAGKNHKYSHPSAPGLKVQGKGDAEAWVRALGGRTSKEAVRGAYERSLRALKEVMEAEASGELRPLEKIRRLKST